MKKAYPFTKGQKRALRLAMGGQNVFITGGSGTGKSMCLMEIISEMEAAGKNVLVCAMTGSAAFRVGGTTIHSLFGFPPEPCINPGGKNRPPSIRTRVPSVLKLADVVAIDEISMVRLDLFDAVVSSVRKAEAEAGHRIQLIVAGDNLQLAPIMGRDPHEKALLESYYGDRLGNGYAFQGDFWDSCCFSLVELDEVVRQKDHVFIEHLNQIRIGDQQALGYFDAAVRKECPDNIVSLYAYKKQVEDRNRLCLAKVAGDPHIFRTIESYEPGYKPAGKGYEGNNGRLKESVNKPPDLTLKEGARIIFTSNDTGQNTTLISNGRHYGQDDRKNGRYVNGMSGIVLSMSHKDISDPEPIIVKTEEGDILEVSPVTLPIYRYVEEDGKPVKKRIGSYTQLPLVLGYAMTIHMAQGKTFSCARICPDMFASGQLYVALSRVISLEGLYLTRCIRPEDIIVDPAVLEFYRRLAEKNQPRKAGRPVKGKEKRDSYIYVPSPLAGHVRKEIECNQLIPLDDIPPKGSGRVHFRIQSSLRDEVMEQIAFWEAASR